MDRVPKFGKITNEFMVYDYVSNIVSLTMLHFSAQTEAANIIVTFMEPILYDSTQNQNFGLTESIFCRQTLMVLGGLWGGALIRR
jgi:hypothetical protein